MLKNIFKWKTLSLRSPLLFTQRSFKHVCLCICFIEKCKYCLFIGFSFGFVIQLPAAPSQSWLQCNLSVYAFNITYWPTDDIGSEVTFRVDNGSPTTKTITGLKHCTEYQFSIFITNAAGLSGPSDQTSEKTDTVRKSENHLNTITMITG